MPVVVRRLQARLQPVLVLVVVLEVARGVSAAMTRRGPMTEARSAIKPQEQEPLPAARAVQVPKLRRLVLVLAPVFVLVDGA